MKAQAVIPFGHLLRRHPDFPKLILDPDYFWRRMMSSVVRPSTVAGECAMLREFAEQTNREVSELRRGLAERQAQHGTPSLQNGQGNSGAPQIRGRVIA